ncbi:MAG TPA: DUF3618 domain-containing protein [Pseudonocardiaceae bacterium]|jgi:hypothetical protein|nr:DUF3618 domain-containing protein [Pseudonocardiaceae bacterium]
MSRAAKRPVPQALAPDASVGEIVAEIDRARHDAADTVAALVAKLDVSAQVRRRTSSRLLLVGENSQVRALSGRTRQVTGELRKARDKALAAAPAPVATGAARAADLFARVPVQARIAVLVVVLLRIMQLRRHRRALRASPARG